MDEFKLNDLFWTFQGEGLNWGRRALFIRMPFCNLKCSWCDTEFNSFKKYPLDEFVSFATSEKARFAVITGGEPLMNSQTPKVIKVLKDLGFTIACETNGMFPYVNGIDCVTCSPKKESGYEINSNLYVHVAEFKYVVDADFDFEVLRRHSTTDGRRYSLSPEFTDMATNVEKITDFIKENPGWKLNLQTHKWIGIK